jgi:hypothetical protein
VFEVFMQYLECDEFADERLLRFVDGGMAPPPKNAVEDDFGAGQPVIRRVVARYLIRLRVAHVLVVRHVRSSRAG